MTNKNHFLILALLLCTTTARAQYNQVNDIPYREAAERLRVGASSEMGYTKMTPALPAHSNDIVAEGETPQRLSDSYSFTEGPAVDARGDVYFTDQPNNKIYRWDCMSGEITLFSDQSGRSNGMYFDAQGNLIACADMDNQHTDTAKTNR